MGRRIATPCNSARTIFFVIFIVFEIKFVVITKKLLSLPVFSRILAENKATSPRNERISQSAHCFAGSSPELYGPYNLTLSIGEVRQPTGEGQGTALIKRSSLLKLECFTEEQASD
jgi:hypothetical protein